VPRPEPQYLVVTDLETVGQPDPENWILEVGIVAELSHVIWQNDPGRIEQLVRLNPEVHRMHVENGLLEDMHKASTLVSSAPSPEELDFEIFDMLDRIGDRSQSRRFRIAGSGVSHFDFPLIKVQLPKFADMLHYAPLDVGQFRRHLQLFGASEWIPDMPDSFELSVKAHRGLADAQAHLRELRAYRDKIAEVRALLEQHELCQGG
jgi:oligoribonuclease (3'-5' exoribonuclease)